MMNISWIHLLNKPGVKIAGVLLVIFALFVTLKPGEQEKPIVFATFEQEENLEHRDHDDRDQKSDEQGDSHDHEGGDKHDEKGEHGDHDEKGGHEEKGEHGDHEEEGGHEEKVVSISLQEMAEFDIRTKTAGPGKLNTYISLPGEIVVNADRLAHIVPRVSGVVLKVLNNLGDVVRRGDIMAILESTELGEAKTEYFQRKKQLEISETDLARARTIHDNTEVLLQILKTPAVPESGSEKSDILLFKALPDMETVLRKTDGLDMGKNRRLLISTYTDFLLTRETYKREKNLYEKKISSQSDFILAKSNFKKAQATYAATYDEVSFAIKRQLLDKVRSVEVARTSFRATERHLHVLGITQKEIQRLKDGEEEDLKLSRVRVSAPISGTVIEKHITLGEMLEKDAKTFVLADLNSVWVNFSVYQKDMPLIRKGLQVIVSAGKGIPDVKGTISYVRSLVGEETRTALARVVLPNTDGLWRPGLFVTGQVVAEKISLPLVIPKSALQTIDEKTIVFVRTDEGFEPKPVTLGKTSETHAQIVAGMKPGQQYVSQGAFTLKAQLAKGGFSAGHSH